MKLFLLPLYYTLLHNTSSAFILLPNQTPDLLCTKSQSSNYHQIGRRQTVFVPTTLGSSSEDNNNNNGVDDDWKEADFWAAEEARLSRLTDDDGEDDDEFEVEITDAPHSSRKHKAQQVKKDAWIAKHPLERLKIIEENQAKAIANKKKREPIATKKRRTLMFAKKVEIKRRRESRVERAIPLYDDDSSAEKGSMHPSRVPLTELVVGDVCKGTVISLAKYGAFIDVGSSRDALLHIRDMSETKFIEHPRQLMEPGMEVEVTIKYVDPLKNRLHASLVPLPEELFKDEEEDDDEEERISVDDMDIDDELWGELKKVSDYGAYIEFGAEVDGFLHFMDHPDFPLYRGDHPSAFMRPGTRVRVWVSKIDTERRRIQVTGNRPASLPLLRRANRQMLR